MNYTEASTKIVIAMLEQGYIRKCDTTDKNIQNVKKAIKEVYQEVLNTSVVYPETNSN